MICNIVPLRSTRHLYRKAIITNLGVIADLPNTQRQNEETKKYASNKKKLQKSSEKELDEMESTKIPDAEFKTVVIKMLKDIRGRMDDFTENLNKEIVRIKKEQKP